MHGVRRTADGLPYGRFQRGRKAKEGRRWLMNLGVTTLGALLGSRKRNGLGPKAQAGAQRGS